MFSSNFKRQANIPTQKSPLFLHSSNLKHLIFENILFMIKNSKNSLLTFISLQNIQFIQNSTARLFYIYI